jgi:hypothetical protein
MEPKLLLIKAITLLFKESLIKDTAHRSIPLVYEVLNTVRLPETGAEFGGLRERLLELKRTTTWMCESTDNGPFDRPGLLQRIRVAAGDDESVYMAFELGVGDGLTSETPQEIQKGCTQIRSELHEELANKEFLEIATAMYRKAAFGQGPQVGTREFIRDMARALDDLAKRYGGAKKIKGMVDEIYFENEETAVGILTRAKDSLSMDGALKFGQTAINDACYDHPGALRGELWLVSALSHNYKSGFGLISFVDLALFNKPWMIDETKKPLIMHISTENTAEQNAMTVYAMLVERETGQLCSTENVDPVYAAHYVKEKLGANGYHTYMCRIDPSDMTVFDMMELVEQKEAEGFEIHACILDYPSMFDKHGLAQGPTGTDLRDLFRRIRMFFSKRKTFCLTFHQLGPSAMQFQRQGVPDLVKEVAGRNHYDGTTKLFQEVDVDITIHIEEAGGDKYLTMQWAKHRKLKRTPKQYWYAAMKMSDIGGLLPDINRPEGTPPNYVRDLEPLRAAGNANNDWFKALPIAA